MFRPQKEDRGARVEKMGSSSVGTLGGAKSPGGPHSNITCKNVENKA